MRGRAGVPRVNGVTEQMSWWRWPRLRQINPMIPDSLLAAFLTVVGVVALASGTVDSVHDRPPDALGYLLVVVGMGCLAWRRRHPIVVLGVAATATTAFTALRYPEGPLPIACLIALYTVATLATRRRSLETVGFVGVLIVVNVVIDSGGLDAGSLFSNALHLRRRLRGGRQPPGAPGLPAPARAAGRRPRADPGRRRPSGPWPRSACASPASSTTWWPTP